MVPVLLLLASLVARAAGSDIAIGHESGYVGVKTTDMTTFSFFSLGSNTPVYGLACNPSNARQYVIGKDRTPILFTCSLSGTCNPQYTFNGHNGSVYTAAFNPTNGNLFASGGADNSVVIWDKSSGEAVQVLNEGHTGGVYGVAFNPSPDANELVSASADRTLRLWSTRNGSTLRVFTGHTSQVNAVAYPPAPTATSTGNATTTGEIANTGDWFLSASSDTTILLWNSTTGQALRLFRGHTDVVWSVAVNPANASEFVSAGEDATVRLWSIDQERPRFTFRGHTGTVIGAAFNPSNTSQVYSAGQDPYVLLWEVETGHIVANYTAARPITSFTTCYNTVLA